MSKAHTSERDVSFEHHQRHTFRLTTFGQVTLQHSNQSPRSTAWEPRPPSTLWIFLDHWSASLARIATTHTVPKVFSSLLAFAFHFGARHVGSTGPNSTRHGVNGGETDRCRVAVSAIVDDSSAISGCIWRIPCSSRILWMYDLENGEKWAPLESQMILLLDYLNAWRNALFLRAFALHFCKTHNSCLRAL